MKPSCTPIPPTEVSDPGKAVVNSVSAGEDTYCQITHIHTCPPLSWSACVVCCPSRGHSTVHISLNVCRDIEVRAGDRRAQGGPFKGQEDLSDVEDQIWSWAAWTVRKWKWALSFCIYHQPSVKHLCPFSTSGICTSSCLLVRVVHYIHVGTCFKLVA